MFNPPFDAYYERLSPRELPLSVVCCRKEDDARFTPDAAFDRLTHGFGWATDGYAYRRGERFRAPSGLDAAVLYASDLTAPAGLARRKADLLLFAMGRLILEREVASLTTLAAGAAAEGILYGGAPFSGDDYEAHLAECSADGTVAIRRLASRGGAATDTTTTHVFLRHHPCHMPLGRSGGAGPAVAFTGDELAQLEAATAGQRGIIDHVLAVVVEAARMKFGGMSDAAWGLVAGATGLTAEEARRRTERRDDWWSQYAAMHDGENPYA